MARETRNTFAALDLGTNNCRMLVAEAARDGFVVVDSFSRITRLGEGMAQTGRLSIAAQDRTIKALRFCAQKIARSKVSNARLVATEACRRASNIDEFSRRVTEETGLVLDVISSGEEASLALAGCAPLLDRERRWALVFDIGGGSTELIWVEVVGNVPVVRDIQSLPIGVVTLAETRGHDLGADGYEALVRDISHRAEPFALRNGGGGTIPLGEAQMLGTSGTVTTLAALHLNLDRYDRNAVDGVHLTFDDVTKVTAALMSMSRADRLRHPCIGAGRADLVLAGCAILDALCRLWRFQKLRVADRGVREGVLLGLMTGTPPTQYVA